MFDPGSKAAAMVESSGDVLIQGIPQIITQNVPQALTTDEILKYIDNHKIYVTKMPPPNKPPNGSIILYDMTVVKNLYREDGHKWEKERHCPRKKKGDVVLHCYVANGSANVKFERRIYWTKENAPNHNIALIHYLEVERKGKTRQADNYANEVDQGNGQKTATNYETGSSSGTIGIHQAVEPNGIGTPALVPDKFSEEEFRDNLMIIFDEAREHPPEGDQQFDVSRADGWKIGENPVEQLPPPFEKDDLSRDLASPGTYNTSIATSLQTDLSQSEGIGSGYVVPQSVQADLQFHDSCFGNNNDPDLSHLTANDDVIDFSIFYASPRETGEPKNATYENSDTSLQTDLSQSEGTGSGYVVPQSVQADLQFDDSCFGNNNEPDLSHLTSNDDVIDFSILYENSDTIMVESSAGSNDMVCSIKDFSPDWAYQNTGTKVLIWGTFSNSSQQGESCQWYCVFGEDEVRAEYMCESVLRCTTPQMKAGRVTFCVKTSPGLVCSEVTEFEFRVDQNQDNDDSSCRNELAQVGLDRLLRLSSIPPTIDPSRSELKSQIGELLLRDYFQSVGDKQGFAPKGENSQITDEHMEERYDKKEQRLIDNVREWLIQTVDTGGIGASLLDKGGQGVLHYAATLGYDWILEPTTLAGVDINFPDVNGWTALHWAAYCGRNKTVGTLFSLGADARAMTSKGRTPAELASSQKHQKLAGCLSERANISQISHHNLESRQAHCEEPMVMMEVENEDSDTAVLDIEDDQHSHNTNALQDAIKTFKRWKRSVKTALSRLKLRRKSLHWDSEVCDCAPGCRFHI